MGNFFNIDGKFNTVMSRVGDLIILNILWFICCIPILTIGASNTALYYVTMKMVKNEESYVAKDFFRSFKQNFKQSTIIWLILLVSGIFLGADLYILRVLDLSFEKFLLPFFFLLFLVYIFILVFIFPILAKFENTIKNTFINSLLFSIKYLPSTFFLSIMIAGSMVIAFIFIQSLPFWIFIGGALIAYLASYLFIRIFDKHIPSGETSDEIDEVSDTEN